MQMRRDGPAGICPSSTRDRPPRKLAAPEDLRKRPTTGMESLKARGQARLQKRQRWGPRPATLAHLRRFACRQTMLREQMIGLQAAVRLKIGEMGWSAKEVYSQGGEHADHARPSCSCATRNAGRMASSIATGALSRTRGSPGPRGAVARAVLGRDQQHQELAWRRGRSRYWSRAPRNRGHCITRR